MELWARGRRAPHAAVPVPVGLGARFCLLPCSVRRWPQQPGLCVFWWSRLGGWGRSQPVGPRGARFRGAEGGGEGPSAPARSSGLTAAVPGQSPAEKLRQGARLPRAAGNGAGQRPPLVPPVPPSPPPARPAGRSQRSRRRSIGPRRGSASVSPAGRPLPVRPPPPRRRAAPRAMELIELRELQPEPRPGRGRLERTNALRISPARRHGPGARPEPRPAAAPSTGHRFEPRRRGLHTWCDLCGDFVWGGGRKSLQCRREYRSPRLPGTASQSRASPRALGVFPGRWVSRYRAAPRH